MGLDRGDDVRNHFVYRAFDKDGRLLYVGCSSRPLTRWNEHRSSSPWWTSKARTFRMQGPYCYRTARGIEREALRSEDPLYGWTPKRHREVRRRDAWANRRIAGLMQGGMDFPVAVKKAYREAHQRFPGARHVTNRPDPRFLTERAAT
ncbi:hypothetical protein RhoFasB10_03827 [Rhodococcus sp. B10]|nr:hypothetical protein [Rhodococcus sp. B10]